jgi:glutamate-1-semialdehyde 2,1-aminomutase
VNERFALGTAQFGLHYGVANGFGPVTREDASAIIALARASGFIALDTAIAYGNSEQRLGEIGVQEWQVISKLPPLPGSVRDVEPWVRNAVLGSLRRLRIPKLHGLMLHRSLQLLGPRGAALHQALMALKEDRKVDKIGVSICSPEELDALWPRFPIELVQAPFNIVDRRLVTSGWLKRLHEAGTEVQIRSVFLQGLLLMPADKRPEAFHRWQPLWAEWHRWLDTEKLTSVQACLGYVLSQPEIDHVVLGVDNLPQLREILASAHKRVIVPPKTLMSTDQNLINPTLWERPSRTVAVVQARMGSTRFPNKVMRPICGTPLIGLLLKRLSNARRIHLIVLATSEDPRNDSLASYVSELGYQVYRGNETDVLARYYWAAKEHAADVVVRVTGDCPLIDPVVVDAVIGEFLSSDVDYASNVAPPTFPNGLDTEVFTFEALEIAWNQAESNRDREHVTPYICESKQFTHRNYANATDESRERWTVDEPEDFQVVQNVFNHFHPRLDFGWQEILALSKERPEWFEANRHFMRHEGMMLGTGQKLWKRAKRIIPGGSMVLSKRAEMYLPDHWPAYFSKAKGCRVWDLDDREYIDMSIMGIGTNTLGYGHAEVDQAVHETVNAGNMSTLNCPEEVYLAERLIELHPWAHMVRLARSGGEANAIAIRIGRAASGRDTVAICGYHGWHDWYLAANLGNEQGLAGHLLPGLEPKGVPQGLRGSILPFQYNSFSELEDLVINHSIGVIMMEVSRNMEPQNDFLEKVRKLATANGIVLVFDECTSGFRQTFGGLHKLFGVEPDMALFGKALGNGYAITALIGKREVMAAAQDTFISSTFWTERIGPTAALKTLQVMERERSWERITQTGRGIGERWQALAKKHELAIDLSGLPALIGFSFPLTNALKYKTLITQEMLKNGWLATTSVYVCTEHTPEIIERYFIALDPLFGLIKQCEEGRNVDELLEGPVCHAGFKRLN